MTGEVFKLDDPQESTDVQRSWLYSKDPSVQAAKKGKTDQRLAHDNELSLPLGDGARSEYVFSDKPGAYRHMRTEITIIKNQPITRK